MRERLADFVWKGDSGAARAARRFLTPISTLFEGVVAARNAAYDRGWLRSHQLALPALSVGNLTVGGTGKTPLASWFASRFLAMGVTPAIILRGYGNDETLVHQRLCPEAIVIADSNRVRAVEAARRRGARVAILDDAFQHRRARRDTDVVLIAAEGSADARLLPAGPWREPLASLGRANVVVVTRKSATSAQARSVWGAVSRHAKGATVVAAHLAPDALVNVLTHESVPVAMLAGRRVTAIAGIGNPDAFAAQLRDLGAWVTTDFRDDHQVFTHSDIRRLHARLEGDDIAVCTLKDAVKIESYWPRRSPSLWYLSQRVTIEQGAAALERVLRHLVDAARMPEHTTPALAGPTVDSNGP